MYLSRLVRIIPIKGLQNYLIIILVQGRRSCGLILGSVCKRMVKLGVIGNRGDLTNEQWEQIEPLLSVVKTKRGRPAQDHRKLLNGIVWVLRTGAPGEMCLRDMVSGPRPTSVSSDGASQASGTGCSLSCIRPWMWRATWIGRSTSLTPPVRAHQHAAGAKKAVPNEKPLVALVVVSAPRSIFAVKGRAD